MDTEILNNHRVRKDKFFRMNPRTPLNREQRSRFDGLAYFPPTSSLDFIVEVTPFNRKTDIQLQTTQGQPRWYRRYGEFMVVVGGAQGRLTIYQTTEGFFLPFIDALAGVETYPAGRYVEPEQLDGNTFHIDFNYAYNPYCAYNASYDCPLTPPENRLSLPIRAGEKIPRGDWVTIQYSHTVDG